MLLKDQHGIHIEFLVWYRDMAFIGIKVPQEVAEKLSTIEVPGERSDPDEMHITLLYLGETSLANIIKAVAVVAAMAQKTKPFLIGCAFKTCFPENPDDGVPIIARVQSPTIMGLQEELKKLMKESGVEYKDKYPDFKPHVTLSYSNEPCDGLGFEPVVWTVESINVWGGKEMDDMMVTSIELNG